MLFFWDIHINHRYQHDIINGIKNILEQYPEEENIVFLGDYVYHFSYDREALLGLYQLWIELFQQGKNLYILSGNHDWIWNSFVFEEAQRAFEIINRTVKSQWKIEFITKPKIENIEDTTYLFFPFSLEYENVDVSLFVDQNPSFVNIQQEVEALRTKKQKNLQLSADVNALLLKYVVENPEITIVHHHYFDGIIFPGEKARFSFKNIALSKYFLDIPNLKFISGHLHQSFCYHNYLCAGSIRNTSSLETNQIKGIYRYTNNQRTCIPLRINPNFSYILQTGETFDQEKIYQLLDTMEQELVSHLNQQNTFWEITIQKNTEIPRKRTSVFLNSWVIDYEKIDTYITPEFRHEIKEVKLKKTKFQSLDIQNLASMYDRKQMNSFSDWKSLLKDFLKNSYPTEYSQYEDFLVKHKIL